MLLGTASPDRTRFELADVERSLVASRRIVERALAMIDERPEAACAHAAAFMASVAELMSRARDLVESMEELDAAAAPGRAITAGDVHDTLGHGLSLAAVLAGGAHATMPDDPRRARLMLGQAATVLAQAQEELGPLFGASCGSGDAPVERDELDLALLVSWALDAGERVVLDADLSAVSAAPRPVLDAAHRTLQEALTNARKHAPSAPVMVRVAVEGRCLVIDVTSGRGARGHGHRRGHGLAVMRRRAESLGGRVAVDRGRSSFSLHVSLPMDLPA